MKLLSLPDRRFPIHSFPSLEECAEKTVHYLSSGHIALSGGSTYAALFPLWAALRPALGQSSFFPVDERRVPLNDPSSNWRMVSELFLDPLGKHDNRSHHVTSAREYQSLLSKHFATMPPVFDVIFLGVGTDGHTASLFPGGGYLDNRDSVVLETDSSLPPVRRITLAPGVIACAKKVIVIIAGKSKSEIVSSIFNSDMNLPILRVLSQCRDAELYFDDDLYRTV
jgi:6-phosphogluconolactonase